MAWPYVVGAVVLVIYVAWLAARLHAGWAPRDFIYMGDSFKGRSGASPAIGAGPARSTSWTGFDGQFYYFIAIDPKRAAPYIDFPSYRYDRIAYPMAARGLVLGQRDFVPQGLLGVNLLA